MARSYPISAPPEIVADTRFVFEYGFAGDLLDLPVVLAPCLVSYGESGELRADPTTRRDDNPHDDWIADDSNEFYRGAAHDAVAMLHRLEGSSSAVAQLLALS